MLSTLKPTSVGFPCVAANFIRRGIAIFDREYLIKSKITEIDLFLKPPGETTRRMEYAFMGTLRERGYTRKTHEGGFKEIGWYQKIVLFAKIVKKIMVSSLSSLRYKH